VNIKCLAGHAVYSQNKKGVGAPVED
jgi:hypothetical protein